MIVASKDFFEESSKTATKLFRKKKGEGMEDGVINTGQVRCGLGVFGRVNWKISYKCFLTEESRNSENWRRKKKVHVHEMKVNDIIFLFDTEGLERNVIYITGLNFTLSCQIFSFFFFKGRRESMIFVVVK